MRKFRASLEPFWDLKISQYVEHLTPVSSEYLISCKLLSLTSTADWISRVFLAYVILWINKASLVLYIVRIAQYATTDHEVWKLYCAVKLVPVVEASKFVTIYWSRSRVGLRLHLCDSGASTDTVYALHWRPLPHAPLGRWSRVSYYCNCIQYKSFSGVCV